MTIQNLTRIQTGPYTFRFTYGSTLTSPTYYRYINGELVDSTTAEFFEVTIEPGETIQFSVFDDPDDVPPTAYCGRVRLQWRTVDGATEYLIQHYEGGAWVTKGTVEDEQGATDLSYLTGMQDDDTVHQFQIVPVGVNEGTPRTISILVVRHPDAPDASYSYNGLTGVVTVT